MTEREKVYQKYDGHCAYCGRSIAFKDMQVDHYYPKRLEGYALTFRIDIESLENKMPSCRRCNHYKRGELPENFRKNMETLHNRLRKIYINKVAEDFGIIVIKPFDGQFYFEYVKEMEMKYLSYDTERKDNEINV